MAAVVAFKAERWVRLARADKAVMFLSSDDGRLGDLVGGQSSRGGGNENVGIVSSGRQSGNRFAHSDL